MFFGIMSMCTLACDCNPKTIEERERWKYRKTVRLWFQQMHLFIFKVANKNMKKFNSKVIFWKAKRKFKPLLFFDCFRRNAEWNDSVHHITEMMPIIWLNEFFYSKKKKISFLYSHTSKIKFSFSCCGNKHKSILSCSKQVETFKTPGDADCTLSHRI